MMASTRRDWLTQMSGVGMSLLPGASSKAAAASLAPSTSWKRYGEMFRHEGEPSAAWVQNFTSAAEPLHEDRWRVWTSLSGPKGVAKNIGFHEGRIGGEWKRTLARMALT